MKYMYFNHLRLISTTTTVGDRRPRNIWQEPLQHYLANNSLCHHGNPNKKPVLPNRNIPSFTPHPLLPRSQHPNFYTVYTFILESIFHSTVTVIILIANFIDVHKILLTKENIVYCVVCFILRKCTTRWWLIWRPNHVFKTTYERKPLSNTNIKSCV